MSADDSLLPPNVLSAVQSIAESVRESDVTTVEMEAGALKVLLRRSAAPLPAPVLPEAETAFGLDENHEPAIVPVTSELVGRFVLRTRSGGAVARGDAVQAGDIVAYIESMSLMNEVKAPVAGHIEEILVEPGHPVEYGQVLMVLSPLQGS